MKWGSVVACAVVSAIMAMAGPAGAANRCALREFASLPLTPTANGMFSVPVAVGAAPERVVLALAGPYSALTPAVAKQQSLIVHTFGTSWTPEIITYMGQGTHAKAYIPKLTIGHATLDNAQALLLQSVAPGTSGVLGLDVLSNFDVELDLAARRLNLFSPQHCAGNVVYWGRPYTVLPILPDRLGVPEVRMQLDGKPVRVKLTALKGPAKMTGALAKALFGITPPVAVKTPVARPVRTIDIIERPQKLPASYGGTPAMHTFRTLSLNGLAIRNVQVAILPEAPGARPCKGERTFTANGLMAGPCLRGVGLTLGWRELRKLRLYFAFSEKKLYVTAADPAPAGGKLATRANGADAAQ